MTSLLQVSTRVQVDAILFTRTLARDSCRSSARTREALAAGLLAPGGSRSAAWKHRNSHTVDVPGRTSSCGTYPAAERTCFRIST
jgi:hypothetical protein